MINYLSQKLILALEKIPIERIRNYSRLKRWEGLGKPVPPPHVVKQKIINYYKQKYGCSILVETGTYKGDMVEAQKNNFEKIISIEISETLFKKAKERFRKESHVKIILGDSTDILPIVVKEINMPAMFWLDGHYSGGITKKGEKETPILEELRVILESKERHIILIDDARLFIGEEDYPTIDEIGEFLIKGKVDYKIEVSDDIIRCTPRRDSSEGFSIS